MLPAGCVPDRDAELRPLYEELGLLDSPLVLQSELVIFVHRVGPGREGAPVLFTLTF